MAKLPAGAFSPARMARETLIVVLVLFAYFAVSAVSADRASRALTNGRIILSLEKGLGIFIEPWMQRLVVESQLVLFFNVVYLIVHPAVTIGVLLYLFTFDESRYAAARNLFVMFSLLAFAIYLLFPAAPPRMIREAGLNDLLLVKGPASYHSGLLKALVNPYAAMPSVHFGYSVIIALTIFQLTRRSPLGLTASIYPILMLVSVAATANHFIADCLAALGILALSRILVSWLSTRTLGETFKTRAGGWFGRG